MSNNIINTYHSIASLFKLSFKLYHENFVGIILLTGVILSPSFAFGILGWSEPESVIFYLSVLILESVMTLGVLGIAFGNLFSAMTILRSLGIKILLGSAFVASFKYFFFISGVMGLTMPFPFSIIIITLWLVGLVLFSMVMPIFILEGWVKRDTNSLYDRFMTPSTDNFFFFLLKGLIFPVYALLAMGRSIKLSLSNKGQVFSVVVLSTVLQLFVFAILFTLFMPDLNLNIDAEDNDAIPSLLSEILSDPRIHTVIRWAQYLSALLFYPFTSLLIVLLYFNSLHRRSGVDIERLSQFSNQTLGTPLGSPSADSASFVSSSPPEAEVKEKISVKEENANPDSSGESNDSIESELKEINKLLEKGLITQKEYDSKKQSILDSI